MRNFFRDIIGTILLAVAIFFLLQFTVQSFIVVGGSMEPTLHNGQRLLVNKIVYNFHEPERGDIIVFYPPQNKETEYIKRIIALPGDTVAIKEGVVYVNGTKLYEPYAKPPNYTFRKEKIPENKYFVLGDNRNNSNDSHNDWLVPRPNITGKAWLFLWPPKEWGLAPNYSLAEQLASTKLLPQLP